MQTTVSVSKAQAQSRDRLEAIVEGLEIMGNPAAMRAIRQANAAKTKHDPLSARDEDD